MKGKSLWRNGVTICVTDIPDHKRPVLAVMIDGENRIYKVASFNSTETADWFIELVEEFFDGLVEEAHEENET